MAFPRGTAASFAATQLVQPQTEARCGVPFDAYQGNGDLWRRNVIQPAQEPFGAGRTRQLEVSHAQWQEARRTGRLPGRRFRGRRGSG